MANWDISLYHDTRRAKNGRVFPVKLRVYYDYKTKFFPSGYDLNTEDFKRSYLSVKPRNEYKDLKAALVAIEARANNIAKGLEPFDWEIFTGRLLERSGSRTDILHYYSVKIAALRKADRIKTAISYEVSRNSIIKFLESQNKKADCLPVKVITTEWLASYESWMLSKGNTRTTVGIYLRALRHLFNNAVTAGEIPKDQSPFRADRYKIPQGKKVKKALTKPDVQKLFFYSIPEASAMYRARVYWFFSYLCSGMNITDIARLKYKNIHGQSIHFVRTKTKETSRENEIIITVPISELVKESIERYGNKPATPETYIFPILTANMNETERVRTINNTVRFINTHMKKLAGLTGIDTNISTYFARHSFATISIRQGASMEFIQAGFGHASISTTQSYFAGFENDEQMKIANNLL